MQDIYLTGNPQITFFKVIYRRHTNFSMEAIQQVFNGSADWGRKVTATISRNGDLIYRTYLSVTIPDISVPADKGFRWLNWLGHVIMKDVEIEIGGQRIDKHYGDYLHIWNELTQTAGHQLGYANMVGNTPDFTTPVLNEGTTAVVIPGKVIYVPLEFWFNRNPGLALPLIALQYHEVKINITLNNFNNCCWMGKRVIVPAANSTWDNDSTAIPQVAMGDCSLYVDYIYLDTDERRRFAQVSHEYLIEQLQYTGEESTNNTKNNIKLNFNHPTKELIWVVQPDDNTAPVPSVTSTPAVPQVFGAQWFNYTDAYDLSYTSQAHWGNVNSALVNLSGSSTEPYGSMPGVAAGGANNVFIPVSFEGGVNPTSLAKLQLNGHDRFSERDGR